MLSRFVLVQAIAIFSAWLIFELYFYQKAVVIVFAISLSHYLLAFLYSKRQFVDAAHNPRRALWLLLLIGAAIALFYSESSLLYLFGLHHALNEAYINLRFASRSMTDRTRRLIQLLSFIAHLSAYMVVAQTGYIEKFPVVYTALLVTCIITTLLYLLVVVQLRSAFDKPIRALFTESLILPMLVVDLWFYDIHAYQIVAYHFVFWVFFPAIGMLKLPRLGPFALYSFLTVATIGAAIYVSPVVTRNWTDGYALFNQQFHFWSFIHIMTAFALSKANPVWLVNLVQGRRTA